jgi:DNA polymerase-3 subunit alpha
MSRRGVGSRRRPADGDESPRLLAETDEGYKNLIKLVSPGYTEGFYYRPRIDKELLAQHSKGLIGLSSCLKGESRERAEE